MWWGGACVIVEAFCFARGQIGQGLTWFLSVAGGRFGGGIYPSSVVLTDTFFLSIECDTICTAIPDPTLVFSECFCQYPP